MLQLFTKDLGPKQINLILGPIPILPTLSKICDRMLRHCITNNVITDKQAADTTVSQLLYIAHNIRQNWGQKKITQG